VNAAASVVDGEAVLHSFRQADAAAAAAAGDDDSADACLPRPRGRPKASVRWPPEKGVPAHPEYPGIQKSGYRGAARRGE